jgi:hypothetical protein
MAEETPRLAPIAEIVRDPRWYPRDRVSPQRVRQCAELYRSRGPDALPPIALGLLPHGPELLLVEGWQRVAGAEIAGLSALPAFVSRYLDGWEILAAAIRGANDSEERGPKPLSFGERGRNVDAFLTQFPGLPTTELAARLGVTREYVWKRQLRLREGRTAANPLAQQARLLLKTAAALHADPVRPDDAGANERRSAVVTARARAGGQRYGEEAGLWLQRLEDLAYDAWRLIAARAPLPDNHLNLRRLSGNAPRLPLAAALGETVAGDVNS